MRNTTLKPWQRPVPARAFRGWPAVLAVLGMMLLGRDNLQAQATVTTIGGGSTKPPYAGYVDGNTLSQAKFAMPTGLALDPSGTVMFVADYTNNAIRMVSQVGNAASLTGTFANATNNGGVAGINHPLAVVVDGATNVFVLNHGNGNNGAVLYLSGISMNSGVVLVYPALASNLANATAMAADGLDNLYVTVNDNKVIKVTTNRVVTTIGTVTQAGTALQGIAVLDNGYLALSDAGNNGIWVMNPVTGTSTKFTGFNGKGDTNGPAQFASFNTPENLAKAGGGILVVADYGNDKVKLVDALGNVSLLYGVSSNLWLKGTGLFPGWADGPGSPTQGSAESRSPYGVLVANDGSVYVDEDYYDVLRHVTGAGLTAPQPGFLPAFNGPEGIAYDSIGNYLFIANYTNNAVQKLDFNVTTNATSVFLTSADGLTNPASVLVDPYENIYVLNQGKTPGSGYISEFDIYGNAYGPVVTGLNRPTAFTLDGYGNFFVAEQGGNVRAFGLTLSNLVATVTNANVSLQGIALFDSGLIAVSDAGNQVIWLVNPITKVVTKLSGKLGVSGMAVGNTNFAEFNQPHQLDRASGNQILVADYGNNRLALVETNGTVTTNNLNSVVNAKIWFGNNGDPVLSGSSKFVPMKSPFGVAAGEDGEVFASETYYSDIRAETGTGLSAPATAPVVPLPVYSSPAGIALDSTGTILYVADPTNNTISALDLADNLTTVFLNAGNGIYQPVDVGVDINNNLYVLNQGTGGNGSIFEFDQYGNLLGTVAASLALPTAMKLDFSGDIFVSELNGAVQEFGSAGSNTLANVTTNANVRLEGISLLDNGSVVVSDPGNQVLWKIPPGSTNAVLFTGVMGSSGANFGAVGFAKLNRPMRLAQANGGLLLIADSGNNRVVVANDAGTVSSALNSTNAEIWFGLPIDPVTPASPNFVPMVSPVGLAIGSGGTVFASEPVYEDIRGMLSTGVFAPTPPPPAPLDLVAAATFGQVSLTWSAANTATNYYIKRSTSTNATFTIVGSTSSTSYTDTNVIGGSTYYYVVSASNAGGQGPDSDIVSATPLIPPPPAPQIGWFDYEENNLFQFVSVMHPVGIATFNNDPSLAIYPQTNGVSTYYVFGPPPLTNSPSATNGSTPPFYQNGILESTGVTPLPNFGLSNVVVAAINVDSVGQVSPITTAEFIFQVANPTIGGFNGAQFTVSDLTSNAQFYYTLDGTDPSNGVPSIGPVALGTGNSTTLSILVTSNVVFKVRAYRAGYSPSGVAEQTFTSSNFVANTISFGFASGEASSAFIASAGQLFYAPVTLTILPNTEMYSLQFNITVTNGGPNPGPAVTPGAFGFQSMLKKPDPNQAGYFLTIPPYMFIGDDTGPLNPSQIVTYEGTNFVNLLTVNTALNLLGVGWLERYTETNLYVTKSQDLIQYSQAHDDLFLQANSLIIAGGYAFAVPTNAANNQTYQIQIARPSATSDGIGAPGSSIYIAAPTNGAVAAGAPVSALKFVTIGQIRYLVGSVYPFGWFNAGDFGTTNIVNADVEQVFESAIYLLNVPPAGSDFFDAMDSCGSFGDVDQNSSDSNYGYYTNSYTYLNPGQTSDLFDTDDTSINQVAFGNAYLDVCDVYVTYRRSLDPSLTWFRRFWNNGQLVADTNAPNVAAHLLKSPSGSGTGSKALNTSSVPPQVNFSAGDIIGTAGQTVQVPINATILGNYPLRILMLDLSVVPLDGSPALTSQVSFNQVASILGAPYITSSEGIGDYAAAWLNSTNSGLTGTVTLGTLTVTIPASAGGLGAYDIQFGHASASPNGLASFPNQKLTGLLSTTARTNSTYGDGIPDSWRLRWFGTVNNLLSVSNACPSGDGIPNWMKYEAGVDPNVANDFPSTAAKTPVPSGSTTAITWPSVLGKQYVIMRATSLFNGPWTVLSTNTGTGGMMEFDDASSAKTRFYRVEILP